LLVKFEDNTNSGVPLTGFKWIIEDVKGDVSGTGLPLSGTTDNINVPSLENKGGAPIIAKYVVTPNKDGCDGVSDTFNITILPSSILNYPDIRLDVCRGTTVNLSKYIDTTALDGLVWSSVSGIPVSSGGVVVIDENHSPGTHKLTYEATNRCITPVVRVAYLRVLYNNKVRMPRNIITMCYEKAEAIQVNQIFGIEAGGTFSYAGDGGDITPYIIESKSPLSPYYGAVVIDGKALYKDPLIPYYDVVKKTKRVMVTYTPAAGSCLAGRTFTTTIILTES
jgi:hypothetical protein